MEKGMKRIGLIGFIVTVSLISFSTFVLLNADQSKKTGQQITEPVVTANQTVYQGVIYPEGLKIAQLRKKYPAQMFYDKFGTREDCYPEPGEVDCEGNLLTPNAKYKTENCKIDLIIKRLTTEDIKCLFVNYRTLEADYRRIPPLAITILKSLKNKPETSSFNYVRDFIWSKEVLVSMQISDPEIFSLIPQALLYYRDIVLETVRAWPRMGRHIPHEYKSDLDVQIITIEENLRRNEYSKTFAKKMKIRLKKLKKLKSEGKQYE